ncbi:MULTISPECIES: hypothetical protein [Pseudomonas]|uniref:hypothetical protein n=1 Tax=Pseudomonas TaxID=286 RepID=UPI002B4097F0|nr:hypothetical protein [Pseudomonas sichuanensis]
MSFACGEIVWPENGREANILLRDFMLKALRVIDYKFPEVLPDPLGLTDKYVSCEIGQLECKELATKWRGQIAGAAGVRDLHSKDALSARLAMLLLSIDESDDQEMMSEKLGWFMEFLQCGGENYKLANEILVKHFICYVEK